jgi:hypothetical protein
VRGTKGPEKESQNALSAVPRPWASAAPVSAVTVSVRRVYAAKSETHTTALVLTMASYPRTSPQLGDRFARTVRQSGKIRRRLPFCCPRHSGVCVFPGHLLAADDAPNAHAAELAKVHATRRPGSLGSSDVWMGT